MWWARIGACVTVLSLVGCAPFGGGTYSAEPDYAPSSSDIPLWQDAVPRPDPILPQGNRSPYQVNSEWYTVLATAKGYREQGIASWYGMKFQGRLTSNGEIFDVFAATAAHRSLPIPSYVRVTNLSNEASVVLRVNDRGPFHPDRLIDVSYGAAVQLGFAEQGTAVVLVESIDLEGIDDRRELDGSAYRYLQLGAYASELAAKQLGEEISERWHYPVTVTAVDTEGERLYRVRLGPFSGADELESARAELIAAGYPSPQRLP